MTAANILYIAFAFVVTISTIVIAHELGHYSAARCFGLIGTRFSIGIGPKIWGWRDKRGTEWRFSPFLIGGYVAFPEDENDEIKPGQKTLRSLPRWQRFIVVAAGPTTNFAMAILLFSLIAGIYGYPAGRPVIQNVIAGSPAAEAKLRAGDEIQNINGRRVITANDVTQNIMLAGGQKVTITFTRENQRRITFAKLQSREIETGDGNKAEIGYLGVSLPQSFQKATSVSDALSRGLKDSAFLTWAQIESFRQIITGQRSMLDLSGPIRIAKMSAHSMSLGLMPYLYIMAILSTAIGFMNILPIPAFDGGHLFTYIIEAIVGRDLPESAQEIIGRIGVSIIILLMFFAIMLDIIALS